MTVISIGEMQLWKGEKIRGIAIEATREELQAVAGEIVYKEVEVEPVKKGQESWEVWENELLKGFVERLIAVDHRVREEKPKRKYSREEVLAMLDEIDPEKETEGGEENGSRN